ncbi:MAG: hypothetical protein ACOCSE_05480 [Chitinivibrionales bacterium]
MKRLTIQALVVLSLATLSCDLFMDNPSNSEELQKTGSIAYSIDTSFIPGEVVKLKGYLCNSGSESDTIPLIDFSIDEYEASKVEKDIQVGNWYIHINAYNQSNEICYAGICSTSVRNNIVTNVKMDLSKISNNNTGTIDLEVTWNDTIESTPPDTSVFLLNANGYTGIMKIAFDDDNLYGSGKITTDGVTWENTNSEFELINTSVNSSQTWKGKAIKRIEFNRSDINQTWHGWGSHNGNFYAGYFEVDTSAGDKKSPWVISKIDTSITVKDVNESTIEGHYTINGNGYKGWIELTYETDSITGHGEFTRDGYTDEETSSPFNLEDINIVEIASWKGRIIKKISFKRSDIDQTWYGWQTWDGKMLAGYFVDDGSAGGTEFGWYAVKEFSESSDSN